MVVRIEIIKAARNRGFFYIWLLAKNKIFFNCPKLSNFILCYTFLGNIFKEDGHVS